MNKKIDLNPPLLCKVDGILVHNNHSIHIPTLNTIFTHEIYHELYENLYSSTNLEIIRLKHNINLFMYEQ